MVSRSDIVAARTHARRGVGARFDGPLCLEHGDFTGIGCAPACDAVRTLDALVAFARPRFPSRQATATAARRPSAHAWSVEARPRVRRPEPRCKCERGLAFASKRSLCTWSSPARPCVEKRRRRELLCASVNASPQPTPERCGKVCAKHRFCGRGPQAPPAPSSRSAVLRSRRFWSRVGFFFILERRGAGWDRRIKASRRSRRSTEFVMLRAARRARSARADASTAADSAGARAAVATCTRGAASNGRRPGAPTAAPTTRTAARAAPRASAGAALAARGLGGAV
ncbi:hypothetical protein M885DRAFT_514259 [Pelagophyceae sp. CCMP2097]|nr:hypothetical protein M885DRAFT_514259 [Pelagophyceae sp. CCMP2097]